MSNTFLKSSYWEHSNFEISSKKNFFLKLQMYETSIKVKGNLKWMFFTRSLTFQAQFHIRTFFQCHFYLSPRNITCKKSRNALTWRKEDCSPQQTEKLIFFFPLRMYICHVKDTVAPYVLLKDEFRHFVRWKWNLMHRKAAKNDIIFRCVWNTLLQRFQIYKDFYKIDILRSWVMY